NVYLLLSAFPMITNPKPPPQNSGLFRIMPIHSGEQNLCVPQSRVRKYTTFYITADYKILDF
ncbi:MAG: hypothetical protein PHN48_01380, partial [Parabacteroides sp.]|nr:hypothetical protein [Parabacteroides sp.]